MDFFVEELNINFWLKFSRRSFYVNEVASTLCTLKFNKLPSFIFSVCFCPVVLMLSLFSLFDQEGKLGDMKKSITLKKETAPKAEFRNHSISWHVFLFSFYKSGSLLFAWNRNGILNDDSIGYFFIFNFFSFSTFFRIHFCWTFLTFVSYY